LISILAPQQEPAPECFVIPHAGVMTRCNASGADAGGFLDQVVKLDIVIAQDARARCFTSKIGVDERAHDSVLEIFFEVENVVGNSELGGYTPGVPKIIQRTASAVILPKLHRKADDLLASLFQ